MTVIMYANCFIDIFMASDYPFIIYVKSYLYYQSIYL